ncbi:MAG: SRPBCC family protein [Kofleriaceae bacterium]
MYQLLRIQRVPRPRAEVFAFFADAANLEALTPPFLAFHIDSPLPIEMRPGAIIDYRLKLHGIPVRWRTVIESFEPGERFVDTQARGPYRVWHHEHRFRDTGDGGTEMTDDVHYDLPWAPLGRLAHPLVRRALRKVFAYRHQVIAARFH